MRILLAGIGNIFFGDDAFGSEVARELMRHPWPEGVRVEDFGIRSYDLAYALLENYDVVVLIDATPRGLAPGTVSLIELDAPTVAAGDGKGQEPADAHSMNPMRVLQMARSMGGKMGRLYLVGCEPETLETEELGLSPAVQASIPQAIAMVESLVSECLRIMPTVVP